AHLDLGEPGRDHGRLGVEPDHAQDLARGPRVVVPRAVAGGVVERQLEVLLHGHAVKRPGDLKAPRDAEAGALVRRARADILALEVDLPALVPERARDAADERRLPGAVRPDQPEALAA